MMFHRTRGLWWLLACLLACLAGLQSPAVLAATGGKGYELGIGTRVTNFSYKESIDPPGMSTEAATFATLIAQAKIYAPDGLSHLALIYEAANGVPSVYAGTDLNSGASVSSTDVVSFTNYEIDLNLALSSAFSVYIGYGYRVWNRFLSGTPGYRELYSWFYMPIGVRYIFGQETSFSYGVDLSVRPTNGGTISVITSETYTGGQDTTMNLTPKTGYRLGVPIRWHWDTLSVQATPSFEHSEIGQSNTAANATLNTNSGNLIYEPNSKTDQFGLELMLGIAF